MVIGGVRFCESSLKLREEIPTSRSEFGMNWSCPRLSPDQTSTVTVSGSQCRGNSEPYIAAPVAVSEIRKFVPLGLRESSKSTTSKLSAECDVAYVKQERDVYVLFVPLALCPLR